MPTHFHHAFAVARACWASVPMRGRGAPPSLAWTKPGWRSGWRRPRRQVRAGACAPTRACLHSFPRTRSGESHKASHPSQGLGWRGCRRPTEEPAATAGGWSGPRAPRLRALPAACTAESRPRLIGPCSLPRPPASYAMQRTRVAARARPTAVPAINPPTAPPCPLSRRRGGAQQRWWRRR